MNLTKLRYFVEVARCGSFSEAARRLYTAQPNLSKQIAQMEQEIGFSLLAFQKISKADSRGEFLFQKSRAFAG